MVRGERAEGGPTEFGAEMSQVCNDFLRRALSITNAYFPIPQFSLSILPDHPLSLLHCGFMCKPLSYFSMEIYHQSRRSGAVVEYKVHSSQPRLTPSFEPEKAPLPARPFFMPEYSLGVLLLLSDATPFFVHSSIPFPLLSLHYIPNYQGDAAFPYHCPSTYTCLHRGLRQSLS